MNYIFNFGLGILLGILFHRKQDKLLALTILILSTLLFTLLATFPETTSQLTLNLNILTATIFTWIGIPHGIATSIIYNKLTTKQK